MSLAEHIELTYLVFQNFSLYFPSYFIFIILFEFQIELNAIPQKFQEK